VNNAELEEFEVDINTGLINIFVIKYEEFNILSVGYLR